MGTIASQMDLLGNFSRHGEWFLNRLTFGTGAGIVQGGGQGQQGTPRTSRQRLRRLERGSANELGRRASQRTFDCDEVAGELDYMSPMYRRAAFGVPIIPPSCKVAAQCLPPGKTN